MAVTTRRRSKIETAQFDPGMRFRPHGLRRKADHERYLLAPLAKKAKQDKGAHQAGWPVTAQIQASLDRAADLSRRRIRALSSRLAERIH
jgi:hypothetical protein